MNVAEAIELLRQILKVLDKIYHALIEEDEPKEEEQ